MPDQTEAPSLIRFTTNVIAPDPAAPGGSRFIVAGQDSPYRSLDEVPINLRGVIASGEPEPQEPNEARANFQTGVVYELTDDNRLGRALRRKVERQVRGLQAENAFEEQLEEQAANEELPPEIVADLEQSHAAAVGLEAAQRAAEAQAADALSDDVAESLEPPELFVQRPGRHYQSALKAKLKPGENVYVREPDGSYEFIGTCDSMGGLPDPPLHLP